MKTMITRNIIVVLFGLLINGNLLAQNIPAISLNIEKAGTLSSLLGNKYKQIESLTLSGEINASDIATIRKMEKLTILDLKNVKVKKGGKFTYSYMVGMPDDRHKYTVERETEDDVIPEEMLYRSSCKELSTIILPNSVTKIDKSAFENYEEVLSNLDSVVFGNSLEIIDYSAFFNCKSLKSINLPAKIKFLGDSAFGGCTNVKSVNIPNGLIKIGGLYGKYGTSNYGEGNTFGRCNALTSIYIPASVSFIKHGSFINCENLSKIEIDKNNKHYLSEDEFIYNITKDTIFAYCCGNKKETVIIPNSVKLISGGTFKGAINIKNVRVYNSTPPELYSKFESSVRDEGILYVPKGSYSNYWLADNWGDFQTIIEMDYDPTANEEIQPEQNINILSSKGNITIEANKPTNIFVYTINGQMVLNKSICGNENIQLPQGFYIVKAGNQTQKVMVK